MTWDELAQKIADMPEVERAKTIFYREPWDEAAEMIRVDLYRATENLPDPAGVVKVPAGEVFLQ